MTSNHYMKKGCFTKHPFVHWVGLFRVCQAAFISHLHTACALTLVTKTHEIDNLRNWFLKNPSFSWFSCEQCLVACDGIVIVIEIDDVFPIVLRTSKRRSESARLIDPINPWRLIHDLDRFFDLFCKFKDSENQKKNAYSTTLSIKKRTKTRISFHFFTCNFISSGTFGIVNDRSGDITIIERHTP